jgi:acyl carrier protein
MNSTEVILEWIRTNCIRGDSPGVDPDSKLLESGVLDSLQVVQVVGFVESHFGVSVDLEDLTPENFESARRIAALADRLRPGGQEE